MEEWYDSLLAAGESKAIAELLHDYEPHASHLGGLSGRVIDIGGGAGIAARFLAPQVDYVVVDPSRVWHSPEWSAFAQKVRGGGPEPRFFDAGGEELPFPDASFDAAIAFWSLNHVREPARCIGEMLRVLKDGGSARIVIDDMEPGWRDLAVDGFARLRARIAQSFYRAEIRMPLLRALRTKAWGEWPLQPDHIRIRERELIGWLGYEAAVTCRKWRDGSLAFDLVRRERRA